MRTVLICQEDAPLARRGMPRWLASFSELAGVVVLRETKRRRWRRIQREAKRIGWLRMFDVVAYRAYQSVFLADADAAYCKTKLAALNARYPEVSKDLPTLVTTSPNSAECIAFLKSLGPDVILASCKHILKPSVFQIAQTGTFALHPGICPEYRNAHGCFWALANDDLKNVGMTLLKIDAGVDTGPVYEHFRGEYDELHETPMMIQRRMTFDHLEEIGERLQDVHDGTARPIETKGRPSKEWGQPWLTKYLAWKWRAKGRRKNKGGRMKEKLDALAAEARRADAPAASVGSSRSEVAECALG